jgi:signal transduction histidine kinase
VSESDEAVFSAGALVAENVRKELHHLALPVGISFYDDGESSFFFERTFNSLGMPDGYFYTVVANKVLDAEAFRIISLVAVLTLFAVILITALLLFGMTVALRPIRELRAAAARVERDEYDHRVKYASPDELGQLATAFNRMLETIGERTRSLKTAVRERQDFLDHATRELRTPLNVFRWTLDVMRFGDTGRLTKEQMELIERLHQTSLRLTKLVQNLQDVTLIDRGRVTLKKAMLSVEDVIDTVAGQVAMEARKKGIELRWNRPETQLPKVPADGMYLEKIILNLVMNAIKYTQQNGFVEVRVGEEEAVRQDGLKGRFVKVEVQDNGIGIPDDDSVRIFSRFFRATNITGFEVEGTGLGLYMSKRLVELHGGHITLESREGVGTTVAFSIPVEDDETHTIKPSIVNA